MDREENNFGNYKVMLNHISTETYLQETVPLPASDHGTVNQTVFSYLNVSREKLSECD